MNRSIPVWVFLLCFLVMILFTVSFAWAVMSTLKGYNSIGILGDVAVEIASFPSTTKKVLLQISGYSSRNRSTMMRMSEHQ